MAELTLEQMQQIEAVLAENEKLTQDVQRISSQLSIAQSNCRQYEAWILQKKDAWISMDQRYQEIQSEESRIQSMQTTLDMKAESIRGSELYIAKAKKEIQDERRNLWNRECRITRTNDELKQKEAEFYNERYKYQEKEKEIDQREADVTKREKYLDQDLSSLYRKTKREAEADFEYVYPITQDLLIFFILTMIVTAASSGFVVDLIKCFYIAKNTVVTAVIGIYTFGAGCFPKLRELHIVSSILTGWILPIVIIAGIAGILIFAVHRYRQRYWDRASRIFFFSALTVCICAGPVLRKIYIIHINTALLFVLLQILYFLVRTVMDLRDPIRDFR